MFIVLASDGIWDVMSNQAVVDFVYNKLIMANKGCKEHAAGSKNDEKNQICGGNLTPMSKSQLYSPVLLPQIADDLLHHCIEELHSQDNVSVVIILLKDPILF